MAVVGLAVVGLTVVGLAVVGLAVVFWGVTKYVSGMYLLVVASRTAASWPLHRNLSNS